MKTKTLTFFCDVSRCDAKTTVATYDGEVGAYLDLQASGWKVIRLSSWKHVCPEHERKDLKP